jgi:uncharacterized membrane protein
MESKGFALIMVVIVVSFMGFWIENIFTAYKSGIMTNRNMILPFLLGYGLFILGLYFVFGTPNAPKFLGNPLHFTSNIISLIYYFSISFLLVCMGEIILGSLTELLCGIIWWNYSDIPLHITRYTSIPTSLGFATIITLFMKFIFNPLLQIFLAADTRLLALLSVGLISFLSLDFIHSGIYMYKNRKLLDIWKIKFRKVRKEK